MTVVNFFDEYSEKEREAIMKDTKVYNDILAALKKYQKTPMLSIYPNKFMILDKGKRKPEESILGGKETPGDLVFSPNIFGTVFLTDLLKICETCKSKRENIIRKFMSYVHPKGYLVFKFESILLPDIMELFKNEDKKNIRAVTCDRDIFLVIKKAVQIEKD